MKKSLLLAIGFAGSLSLMAQTVSKFSGTGTAGLNITSTQTAAAATYNGPANMFVDANDRMWIVEASGYRLRVLQYANNPTSVYSRIGSTASQPGKNNGTGVNAKLWGSTGVVVDSLTGNIYIADGLNNCIRRVDKYFNVGNVQAIWAFAGDSTGAGGYTADNIAGSNAKFNTPTDLEIDPSGNIYVADAGNNCIRKITPSGIVTTIAGSTTYGTTDGVGSAAKFAHPTGLAWYSPTELIVVDQANSLIRKLDITTKKVTTLAGIAGANGTVDGDALNGASFSAPVDAVVDKNKNIYITEGQSNAIRIISGSCVSTFAGVAGTPGSTDGTGVTALFDNPAGIIIYKDTIYVADMGNHTIRKITPSNVVPGPAPVAGFVNPITAGNPNKTYTFHDSTTNGNSRIWRFTPPDNVSYENGTDSSSQDVAVQFSAFGSYAVTLTVVNCWGRSTSSIHTIVIDNTGIHDVNVNEHVSVYPNPTKGIVEVNLEELKDENLAIRVMDITGKVVYENKVIAGKQIIDMSNNAKGVYLLNISGNQTAVTRKLVVE